MWTLTFVCMLVPILTSMLRFTFVYVLRLVTSFAFHVHLSYSCSTCTLAFSFAPTLDFTYRIIRVFMFWSTFPFAFCYIPWTRFSYMFFTLRYLPLSSVTQCFLVTVRVLFRCEVSCFIEVRCAMLRSSTACFALRVALRWGSGLRLFSHTRLHSHARSHIHLHMSLRLILGFYMHTNLLRFMRFAIGV